MDFLGLAENGQIDDRFKDLATSFWKVFKVAVCRQPVKKIQLKTERLLLFPKVVLIELGALNARKRIS